MEATSVSPRRGLAERRGQLGEKEGAQAVSAPMHVGRLPQERIDHLPSRRDILRNWAQRAD
eukprot:9303707-Pyramimonas_sp.AAC.1